MIFQILFIYFGFARQEFPKMMNMLKPSREYERNLIQ